MRKNKISIVVSFSLAVLALAQSHAQTWPKLDDSDSFFYESIYAPRVVAIQPNHTHKEMVVMSDGEIRYYGSDFIKGKPRRVYLSSEDRGLSWNT